MRQQASTSPRSRSDEDPREVPARARERGVATCCPGRPSSRRFLRTYAEDLGLDPHLLVEEYRLQLRAARRARSCRAARGRRRRAGARRPHERRRGRRAAAWHPRRRWSRGRPGRCCSSSGSRRRRRRHDAAAPTSRAPRRRRTTTPAATKRQAEPDAPSRAARGARCRSSPRADLRVRGPAGAARRWSSRARSTPADLPQATASAINLGKTLGDGDGQRQGTCTIGSASPDADRLRRSPRTARAARSPVGEPALRMSVRGGHRRDRHGGAHRPGARPQRAVAGRPAARARRRARPHRDLRRPAGGHAGRSCASWPTRAST